MLIFFELFRVTLRIRDITVPGVNGSFGSVRAEGALEQGASFRTGLN